MPMTISTSLESLTDRVIGGERITPEEALELYRLPLEELGALADHRRKQIVLKIGGSACSMQPA